jgi:hypothetical protein
MTADIAVTLGKTMKSRKNNTFFLYNVYGKNPIPGNEKQISNILT